MAASRLQFTIGRFFAHITIYLAAFTTPIIDFSFILSCALISLILYLIDFKTNTVPKNSY
ncbi:hypothetical protein [Solibacillus sp. CAU 1738]|uniref:hypothetical protein n=1 Tax=Solibacillus sp. CAU 1738 TaxID=3140363 RepID=UPI0032609278